MRQVFWRWFAFSENMLEGSEVLCVQKPRKVEDSAPDVRLKKKKDPVQIIIQDSGFILFKSI